MLWHAAAALCLGGILAAQAAEASLRQDASRAVIFAYHRVGEDSQPGISISKEKFSDHISQLTSGGYNVLPLSRVIEALESGKPLPEKTIAITFEGAWQATWENALPLLEKAGLPYTIFLSTDMATGGDGHMAWRDIKTLQRSKLASFGIQPAAYVRMVDKSPEENAALINRAIGRFRDEMGGEPAFFSYPYGEYSQAIRKQVAGYGFKAAFGQQSGVAYAGADMMTLPRFTMTDAYGDLDRFMLTANALPLPVSDVVPTDTLLDANPPPQIGFSVDPALGKLDGLSCFISGQGKASLQTVGGRVEIRLEIPFVERLTRINCTLPDDTHIPGQPQAWRWFGMVLIDKDGGYQGAE